MPAQPGATKPGIAPSLSGGTPTLGPKPVPPSMPSVAPTGLPPLGGGTKPPIPQAATPGAPPSPTGGPSPVAPPKGAAAPAASPAKAKPSILFLLLDFLVFGGSVAGCVLLFLNY